MRAQDWVPDAVRDTERRLSDIELLLVEVRNDRDRYRSTAQETGSHIWTQQEANYREIVRALDRAGHLAADAAKRWRRTAERYEVTL